MRTELILLLVLLWTLPSSLFLQWMSGRESDAINKQFGLPPSDDPPDAFSQVAIVFLGLLGPFGAVGAYLTHIAWFGTWRI